MRSHKGGLNWPQISHLGIKNLDSQARATYDDHLVISCPIMETTLSLMEEKAYVRSTFAKLPSGKKKRILDVAIDEFSRCGYEQASINRMV